MRFDLHVHSKYSRDASNKPETIIKVAQKKKLGIGITDHDNTKAWKKVTELGKKSNVPVVLGEEIKVRFNGKKCGELMSLFLQEALKAKEYPEVMDEIKAQDALIVAPHPFDFWRSNFKFLEKEKTRFDLIEAFNSRCYFTSFNDKALKFALKNGLKIMAGSDAHFPWEIGNAFVEAKAETVEELRHELLHGKVFVHGIKSPLSVHLWTGLRKHHLVGEK